MVTGDQVDTGASVLSLRCQDNKFVSVSDGSEVSVESATCSRKQEPRLVRDAQVCSDVGADGRVTGTVTVSHIHTYGALF